MNKDIKNKISQLGEKYGATGQDLMSYLDGLLYADYLSYWDYIHLDTLLSLQNPKTDFPDEKIFITYHQITELYFKLIINELDQISNNGRHVLSSGEDLGWKKSLEIDFFIERLQRIIRYFENLVNSFDIMISGMDKKEFLKFRMALLPGSGFQSIQFRLIEIYSTDFKNLCVSKNNLISKKYNGNSLTNKKFNKLYTIKINKNKNDYDFNNFLFDGKNLYVVDDNLFLNIFDFEKGNLISKT